VEGTGREGQKRRGQRGDRGVERESRQRNKAEGERGEFEFVTEEKEVRKATGREEENINRKKKTKEGIHIKGTRNK
jgi:hypothetical protein